MERRAFCTMIRRNSSVTVVEKFGFEMKIHGMEFYAYVSNSGTVYIIDPETGLSVYEYIDENEQCITDFTLVAAAKMKLEELQERLEKLKEFRQTQVYEEAVSRFERCKELALSLQ